MVGRIIEICRNDRHLALYRGFLLIRQSGNSSCELARIPLDEILAVIAHAHGLSYTNNVLCELAQRGIPFVLCNDLHQTVGIVWPVESHHLQAQRIENQVNASLPTKKRLWAQIVRSKIHHQATLLEYCKNDPEHLRRMIPKVKSGDPDNYEAQAARIYWKLLFGKKFVRDRELSGVNSLLNYGYTILRSSMARAVIATGLHPSIGLHHCNGADAMRLVDDLMEPFRPVIDHAVLNILKKEHSAEPSVTPENKSLLVSCLFKKAVCCEETSPVTVAMQNLALSLSRCFAKEKQELNLPVAYEFTEDFNDRN